MAFQEKPANPGTPLDKNPDIELTEAELVEQANKLTQEKYASFLKEYEALCDKYKMEIKPKIQLEVTLRR